MHQCGDAPPEVELIATMVAALPPSEPAAPPSPTAEEDPDWAVVIGISLGVAFCCFWLIIVLAVTSGRGSEAVRQAVSRRRANAGNKAGGGEAGQALLWDVSSARPAEQTLTIG